MSQDSNSSYVLGDMVSTAGHTSSQRKGVASFWEDGLCGFFPQGRSLTCETELEALSWVAHNLLLGLCTFPVCLK